MKISWSCFFLAFLLVCSLAKPEEGVERDPNEKVTILTFYIQQEDEQAEDFIEMSLTLQQKDTSLKKTIAKVELNVAQIKITSKLFCEKNGGTECEERVEVEKHQIVPEYQIIRKQPLFNGFSVVQEIKINVKEVENIGELVDSILEIGVYKINSFEWKPFVEADSEEIAIEAGISQARDLCNHINRRIGDVLAIEEVFENGDKDGGEEEGDEKDEDQDGEEEGSILKFVVECVSRKGKDGKIIPEPEVYDEPIVHQTQQVKQEEPEVLQIPEQKPKKKKKKKKDAEA